MGALRTSKKIGPFLAILPDSADQHFRCLHFKNLSVSHLPQLAKLWH